MKAESRSKILLAIGNDETRKLLQKRLTRLWGGEHDLIYAEEIEDAVALTKLHKPILIILEDMCYCSGMGLEAIQELRKINEQVKIIALVWDDDDDIEEMLAQGGVKILMEGYKLQSLFEAIEDFLGSQKRLALKTEKSQANDTKGTMIIPIKTKSAATPFYISKVKDVFLVLKNGDYKDTDGKLIRCSPIEFARSYKQENAELILKFLNEETAQALK